MKINRKSTSFSSQCLYQYCPTQHLSLLHKLVPDFLQQLQHEVCRLEQELSTRLREFWWCPEKVTSTKGYSSFQKHPLVLSRFRIYKDFSDTPNFCEVTFTALVQQTQHCTAHFATLCNNNISLSPLHRVRGPTFCWRPKIKKNGKIKQKWKPENGKTVPGLVFSNTYIFWIKLSKQWLLSIVLLINHMKE